MYRNLKILKYVAVVVFLLFSCEETTTPKPGGYLALNYPEPTYSMREFLACPYAFEINQIAKIQPAKAKQNCWYNIEYPTLNATLFLSYRPVNKDNLRDLLVDAQRLPLEHTIKADEIEGDTYVNNKRKVYGTFYEVKGDAASQAQFYVTDSVNHFLTGSLYFKTKPNFDSIQPAAAYLKTDMKRLLESLQWR
ncbi:gliding motility lipoprotein GldD [uncultured Mesonia sp.]|uniref:gliding motility lipoprotein GldD n=1 Tax=uncultured Mesonia sp. TaxID=399731 RepID=UPI00374EA9E7